MTTTAIIAVLFAGCVLGGCGYVGESEGYKKYVKPHIEKLDNAIDPYRTPEDNVWDKKNEEGS